LILRSALYSFLSTIIVLIIAVSVIQIRNKIANRIIPFKEDTISVLILPFDPLEDCTSKKEDMAKAVYKNLKKQIIDVSLKDFDVEFLSNGLPEGLSCPNNHEEARKIGERYKADMVVWGVQFERTFPEISRVCINYTITVPNTYLEKQIGTTGVQQVTTDLIYEGKLLNDVNHVVCFLIAQYYYQISKLPEAALYFEKSANYVENKKDHVLVDIFFNLGDIYIFQNEYIKAIDFYEKALQIKPNFTSAIVALGLTYTDLKQHQKAIEYYSRAVKITPIFNIDFNARAIAYHMLGQYQGAIDDFNKAIELNPKYYFAYSNRGHTYNDLGQYQKAIDDFNKAIELNPQFAIAYNNRGNAHGDLGQYQKAIDDFNKAIELNPHTIMLIVTVDIPMTT